jgi:mRNA-degrading endonuclease RelE of RelBE toxin-antitoxin system
MIEIILTKEFEERFSQLSLSVKKKAVKQQEMFCKNPFYPSLHTEKLQPRSKKLWSIRIDKNYRIVFRHLSKNQVLFLTVGTHDWIYKLL